MLPKYKWTKVLFEGHASDLAVSFLSEQEKAVYRGRYRTLPHFGYKIIPIEKYTILWDTLATMPLAYAYNATMQPHPLL